MRSTLTGLGLTRVSSPCPWWPRVPAVDGEAIGEAMRDRLPDAVVRRPLVQQHDRLAVSRHLHAHHAAVVRLEAFQTHSPILFAPVPQIKAKGPAWEHPMFVLV
jgi:hypothetical protein